jgi:acetolactate synthase-1/2/3 large subunit
VVIAGGGARDPEALSRLAEAAGAPLVTTWLRQDRASADSPAFLGSLGYGAHPVTEQVVAEADVLVALGCRFSEFSTKRWTLVPSDVRLVHVDVDPTELGRVYLPEVGLIADAALTARQLADRLEVPSTARAARLRELRATYVRQASLEAPELAADDPRGGVSSIAAVRGLQAVLERDEVVVVQDAPSFGPWSHRYLRQPTPGRFFGSAGGAMAWGLPAGMGIALARPDLRVVTVSGDGSFWMVAQDFETCVREDIGTVNVVMNNDSYGNTRDRQRSALDGRYLGVFYGNPDFAAFARSLGGYGIRVTRGEDLVPALHEALDQDLPAIVEVVQDQMYGLPPGLLPPAAR